MTSSEAGRKTKIAIAFFAGIAVALAIAYALAASLLPPRPDLGIPIKVLHPFLRLPSWDDGVFATSIAFNGLYYAAVTAIRPPSRARTRACCRDHRADRGRMARAGVTVRHGGVGVDGGDEPLLKRR